MSTCGATRLLIPAFLVGFAVATFSGNDAYGWVAAALTGAVLFAVQRVRGTSPTCAISPPAAVDERADVELHARERTDLPNR